MTNQYNTEVTNITTTGSDVLVFTASATTTLLKTISWYSSYTASIQLKLKKYGGTTTEITSFSAGASKSTPLFSDLIALKANDEVYIQTDAAGSLTIVMVTSSESLSGQSIDVLIDVDTTGSATGDLLVYNGTSWVADSGSSSLNLTVGAVDFELTTPPSLVDGRLAYDIDRESLIFQSEHGELAIGETYKPVYNNTGSTIAKGSTVKATGVSGEKFLIELFDASSGVDEELYFVGVTQAAINDQTAGIVVSEGLVKHLDTSTYSIGDILYASETAGGLTTTRPTSPNLGIPVAMVTKVDGTNGTIYVRPSIYNHLEEIHDVSISSVANNQLLAYSSTSGVWQNVSDITINSAYVLSGGILSLGNISTTGNLSAATLNVPGAVSFGQITSSTGVLTPSITFTNAGQSIIGVGGLGPDDLVIQSNGNVTVELDADNDETSQKFAVNDPSATERFSVSDAGVVTINSAFSLPTSDGTSGQTLQTNGTGTVSWITPTTPPSVIDDLSDVFVATPTTGEFLKYDGAEWTNDNVTLNEVFDVNLTSVADAEVLTYDSATSKWINQAPNYFFTVSSNSNTAITLASGDEGKYIRTTATTAVTVTIPSGVFSVGDEILIEQAAAGQVTVAAGTGVTLNNSASNTAKTAEQYAVVGLKCVASDVFTLTGERELV